MKIFFSVNVYFYKMYLSMSFSVENRIKLIIHLILTWSSSNNHYMKIKTLWFWLNKLIFLFGIIIQIYINMYIIVWVELYTRICQPFWVVSGSIKCQSTSVYGSRNCWSFEIHGSFFCFLSVLCQICKSWTL